MRHTLLSVVLFKTKARHKFVIYAMKWHTNLLKGDVIMILLDIFLTIVYYLLQVYALCIVIAGILSLVGANPMNPIVTFFRIITAIPCKKITSKFPKLIMRTGNGFMDLSPIVLLLIVACLMIIVQKIGFYLGIYI